MPDFIRIQALLDFFPDNFSQNISFNFIIIFRSEISLTMLRMDIYFPSKYLSKFLLFPICLALFYSRFCSRFIFHFPYCHYCFVFLCLQSSPFPTHTHFEHLPSLRHLLLPVVWAPYSFLFFSQHST